jgi:gluconokinase
VSLRVVVMGVSGCGKSSVAAALAAALDIPWQDGDDLHPTANVEKMRAGTPLTDDDRWPWLDRVAKVLSDTAPVIIACSALRRAYRDRIRTGARGPVRFVYLAGSRNLIATRLDARRGHYMPASLLDSQFAALEPPTEDEALIVDAGEPLTVLVAAVIADLQGSNS